MTTTPTTDQDVLNQSFTAAADFLELANHCDRFAETLIDCDDTAEKLALLGRIGACLALLRPTLNDPIPDHLIDCLTTKTLPAPQSHFEPDSEALCDYCQTLAQVLCQQSFLPETEKTLRGLLCELVWMFAADLKAPRWVSVKLPQ
ncbi:hypothetical protein ACLBW0_03305 [Enterobacteriaceae bacterium C34A]